MTCRSRTAGLALRLTAWLAVACVALTAAVLSAQGTAGQAELGRQFAPTGTLRAGINYNNPLLARRDPASGELSGVAVDIAREVGRRLALPVQLLPYESAGRMTEAVKAQAWDLAFLGIDPARATEIDFTAAYIELEGTYLVPAGSPLRTVDEVDRAGIRVAVTANSAYDLFLSRAITRAQLVRVDNTPKSIEVMVDQKLDAVAAVKTALVAASRTLPGSRVLPGHFMTIPQAAAVPKGRPESARFARQLIEELKQSGFVADALKRHGLGPDDAIVAPAVPVP